MLFKERDCDSAGTYVGTYDRTYGSDGQIFRIAVPEVCAVLDVLFQHSIADAAVIKALPAVKINTAAVINELTQEIIAVF